MANEVRQILWPDGDDAISAIDAIHIGRESGTTPTNRALFPLRNEIDSRSHYHNRSTAIHRERGEREHVPRGYKDITLELSQATER